MKAKFRKNSINPITGVQYKEKLSSYLDQVKRAKVANGHYYHFKFNDGVEGISVVTDTNKDFLHTCEHFAQGRTCHHMASAYAVATILGHELERFGLISDINDLEPFRNYDYEDINIEVGLPEFIDFDTSFSEDDEEEETPAAVVAPVAPVKKKVKRNPSKDWNEIEEFLKVSLIPRNTINLVKAERITIFANVEITPMTSEPTRPQTLYMGPMLERAIKHILLGESLLLIGEKGSGSAKRSTITA